VAFFWILSDLFIPWLRARKDRPDTFVSVTRSEIAEKNKSLYGMIIMNSGKGMDKKINVNFLLKSPSSIISVTTRNPERVKLVGKSATGATFILEELYPGEWQVIEIEATGNGDCSVKAWSEKSKKIKKIGIVSIKFGPEESYEDWKKKQTK